MNADTLESFARLAGTLALLATYKIARGGGLHRARQRIARAVAPARKLRAPSGRSYEAAPRPSPAASRARRAASGVMFALWLSLLLMVLGYIAVSGESAFSDFDEARLITDF